MKKLEFIPVSQPDVTGNERNYLNECIETGWVSSVGSFVTRFEEQFAKVCACPYGISVNSGTAALHLALRVLDIGPDDEVIVPALTFAATANSVLYQGATPIVADCSTHDWNMDPAGLEDLITPKTRAIIPVHLYGTPCDMDAIGSIAARHGIPIVEDCAEAHGAQYKGQPVGSFGTMACFSFYGNKVITSGEGGICVTGDPELNQRMRLLRDHGMNKQRRYWHDEVGYNYRMTNLQAAVGCAQLERMDEFIAHKRWVKGQYQQGLQGLNCLLPEDPPETKSVFWLYTMALPEHCTEQARDELIRFLAERRIDSRPVFYVLTDMPPYQHLQGHADNARPLSARGITLPSFNGLNEHHIARICGAIREWFKKTE